MEPVVTLSAADDPTLRDTLYDNFAAHAAVHGVVSDFEPLTIRLERAGTLVGGLMGRTGRGWLHVELLALPLSDHGTGLGTRLIGLAEAEALRRGCVGSFLNTIAFQAPEFYRKLGYTEFATLPHDDPALSRIWFQKRLA